MKRLLLLALLLFLPSVANADERLVKVFKQDFIKSRTSPLNYLIWATKKYPEKNIFVLDFFADGAQFTNTMRVNFNRKTGALYMLTNRPDSGKLLERYDSVTFEKLQKCVKLKGKIRVSDDGFDYLEDLNCPAKIIYSKNYPRSGA